MLLILSRSCLKPCLGSMAVRRRFQMVLIITNLPICTILLLTGRERLGGPRPQLTNLMQRVDATEPMAEREIGWKARQEKTTLY